MEQGHCRCHCRNLRLGSVHFNWWRGLLTTAVPLWSLFLLIVVELLGYLVRVRKRKGASSPQKGYTGPELEPNLSKINVIIPPEKKDATYPFKCYVQLRNDSALCVEVRVCEYRLQTVTAKQVVFDVLQLKLR
jgi:hypothetical protein